MVETGAVQKRLRRKAHARQQREQENSPPFSKVLRAWLVKARHNRACSRNHEALMKVQADWSNGLISTEDIQERVRRIVVESETLQPITKPDATRTYYSTTISNDRKWEQTSTCFGNCIEIIISRYQMRHELDSALPLIAYYVAFGNHKQAMRFHFGLIERLKSEGDCNHDNPIDGFESLENADIVYASEDPALATRYSHIVECQKTIVHSLNNAALMLQAAFRYKREHRLQDIDAILESIEGMEKQKKQKRRKKKKRKKKPKQSLPLNDSELGDLQTHENNSATEETENRIPGSSSSKQTETILPLHETSNEITGKYYRVSPEDVKLFMVRPASYQLSAEMYDLLRGLNNLVKLNESSKTFILQQTEDVIRTVLPCAKLHLFGSYASQLQLPSSDVDCFYYHFGGEAGLRACETMNFASAKGPLSTATGKHATRWGGGRCSMYLPVVQQLDLLRQQLWRQPWVKRVTLAKSSMPVLRMEVCASMADAETEDKSMSHLCGKCFTLDVSCGHSPGHNNFYSSEFLLAYSHRFRQFRGLTVILKKLLVDKNLNNPFKGGLGSFNLALMVIAFLKMNSQEFPESSTERNKKYCSDEQSNGKASDSWHASGKSGTYRHLISRPNLTASHHASRTRENVFPVFNELSFTGLWNDHRFGPLLIDLLDFYGNKFDPRTTGISVRGDVQFYPIPTWMYPPAPLVVDSPFWPGKNLATSCYAFSSVQNMFRHCHNVLKEALEKYELSGKPTSILREIFAFKWGHTSKRILMSAMQQKLSNEVGLN